MELLSQTGNQLIRGLKAVLSPGASQHYSAPTPVCGARTEQRPRVIKSSTLADGQELFAR